MIYEVIRIEEKMSMYGGKTYMVLLRDLKTLKTFRTWVCPHYGNYKHWQRVIELGKGTKITGLNRKNKYIIDADSKVSIVNEKLF